jgi:signal transduction histidine kinase
MSKVLVAEDEPALLESFCDLIVDLGHECLPAKDGHEALDLARKHHPDLVITDYMMPGRSGVEVIQALVRDPILEHIPTILISAGRPPEVERRHAWRFLSKPVGLEYFEQAITEGLKVSSSRGKQRKPFVASAPEDVSPETLAREQMLGWVAHEIKSPLSAALTSAQLAIRGLGSHALDVQEKRLNIIVRQLSRMDELVNSILDAAQLQEGKLRLELEEVNASELIHRVVCFWKDMHPDYDFSVEDGQGVTLEADPERLRQVLDNLISNAIKYGGPTKAVRIEVVSTEVNISIRIIDQGPGIAAEELPQLFNRFHRVAGQGGRGHGLGLYISAALARLHGGTIKVESELDRGSVFTLVLPRKL